MEIFYLTGNSFLIGILVTEDMLASLI